MKVRNQARANLNAADQAMDRNELSTADQYLNAATRCLFILSAQGQPVDMLVNRLAELQDRYEAMQG